MQQFKYASIATDNAEPETIVPMRLTTMNGRTGKSHWRLVFYHYQFISVQTIELSWIIAVIQRDLIDEIPFVTLNISVRIAIL